MKKLLLLLSVIGTLSCSSCVKSHNQPAPTCSDAGCDINASHFQKIIGDNWELSLPKDMQKLDPPFDAVKIFASINDGEVIILFMEEGFSGSNEEYTLAALHGIKEHGADILSISSVKINDVQFSLIESAKNNIHLWTWDTVKNGVGYALSCGEHSVSSKKNNICFNIANTLKFK